MRNIRYIFLVLFVSLCLLPDKVTAQLNDIGGIGSISVSKELNKKIELGLEQEFRFDQNFTSLNRSATSVSADFTLIRKILKAKVDYNLLYRRNDDRYEIRHRASFSFTGQQKFSDFNFRLRTRVQSTFRDENRGDYKFNPKFVWRNRLDCSYDIPNSPFRPYITGEIFCPLNSEFGFFMDSYRLTLGTKYRISKRHSLDLQFRFDQDIQQKEAQNILYFGVGWSYSL